MADDAAPGPALSASARASGRRRSVAGRELATGALLKRLLPLLLHRGIVDFERGAALNAVEAPMLEGAVLTSELMSLAIALGVTASAAEFWQVHKSRDELLFALYDHVLEQDARDISRLAESEQQRERVRSAVAEPAVLPLPGRRRSIAEGGSGSALARTSSSAAAAASASNSSDAASGAAEGDEEPHASMRAQIANRRLSLVGAPAVFQGKEYAGDLYGTGGDYTEGHIYASRLGAPLDDASRAKLAERMEQQSAITQLARTQARRSSIVQAQLKELKESHGSDELIAQLEEKASDELMLRLEVDLAIKDGVTAVAAVALAPQRRASLTARSEMEAHAPAADAAEAQLSSARSGARRGSAILSKSGSLQDILGAASGPPVPDALAAAVVTRRNSVMARVASSPALFGGVASPDGFAVSAPEPPRLPSEPARPSPPLPRTSFEDSENAAIAAQSAAHAAALVAAALAALPPDVRALPAEGETAARTVASGVSAASAAAALAAARPSEADYEDEAFATEGEGGDIFDAEADLQFRRGLSTEPGAASAEALLPLHVVDASGAAHRIGSTRFYKSAERPPRTDLAPVAEAFSSVAAIAATASDPRGFREQDSVQMRRIRARLDDSGSAEPALGLRQQESYHEISRMMAEEREQAAAAASILDSKRVPAARVRGLMSFVLAHQDEIAGATGGMLGTIHVDHGGAPPGLFSPLKSSPSAPSALHLVPRSATADLSQPMIDRQLSKVELYFKPVVETNKDVLVLEHMPPSAYSAAAGARSSATAAAASASASATASAAAAAAAAEAAAEVRRRLKSRVEWGGGRPVNTAVSKIQTRRAPLPADAVRNEFSEAEVQARRAAAERSKRLLMEIRAIERQLAQQKLGDRLGGRALSRSPSRSLSPRVGLSARESLASLGADSDAGLDALASASRGWPGGVAAGASVPSLVRPQLPLTVGRSGGSGLSAADHVAQVRAGHGSALAAGGRSSLGSLAGRGGFGGGVYSAGLGTGGASAGGRGSAGGGFGGPPATATSSVVFAEGSVLFDFEAGLAQPSLEFEGAGFSGGGSGGGSGASEVQRPRGSHAVTRGRKGAGPGAAGPKLFASQESVGFEMSLGPGERDLEFDAVARKLARLRAAELKQRAELRLLRAYTVMPLL